MYHLRKMSVVIVIADTGTHDYYDAKRSMTIQDLYFQSEVLETMDRSRSNLNWHVGYSVCRY